MSYDDVDEIKKQLHDAYMKTCVNFVKSQSPNNFKSFEVKAFESSHFVFSVKMESKNNR